MFSECQGQVECFQALSTRNKTLVSWEVWEVAVIYMRLEQFLFQRNVFPLFLSHDFHVVLFNQI